MLIVVYLTHYRCYMSYISVDIGGGKLMVIVQTDASQESRHHTGNIILAVVNIIFFGEFCHIIHIHHLQNKLCNMK